jgi:hypothetical protein
MKIPIALFIAILSLAISAGTMVYSVRDSRSVIHLDPELERLARGFLQEEERRREEYRKTDAETHRVEQNLVIPTELPRVDDLDFGSRSLNFGSPTPKHK